MQSKDPMSKRATKRVEANRSKAVSVFWMLGCTLSSQNRQSLRKHLFAVEKAADTGHPVELWRGDAARALKASVLCQA